MAEEVGQRPGPRARFQGLADLKIGSKFSLNLRILLEPIGALKFLLIFTSLFALALTAGYGSTGGSSNRATCQNSTNDTFTIRMTFSYPYHPPGYTLSYSPNIPSNSSSSCFTSNERRVFTGSAEYFVAMSSFTFVFSILCFPLYFVFYVPRYDLAKYLSLIDLIITAMLVFFYFIADIAWAAGINQINSFHGDLLKDRRSSCLDSFCNVDEAPSPVLQNYAQLSVSVLFGWISAIILTASLWFIYKDTIVHQDRMGPLYQLPFFSKKNSAKTPEEANDPSRSTYTPSKQKEDENDKPQDAELTVEVHPEIDETI